jgi:hypothetical protein
MATALTPDQSSAVEIAERVSSVFSVIGALFIIFTFLCDSNFRKPINRLVFYASWGNLFATVATLITREGIRQGADGPLCQFQAFLIQWCEHSLETTTIVNRLPQVHAGRRAMDIRHGVQCVLDILQATRLLFVAQA